MTPVWIGMNVVGQSGTTGDRSAQAADLLRRARQAMVENDLSAADSLIAQAEALGVTYNALYMGDTPKKARHDLERKRNSSGASLTKSNSLLAPFGGNKGNIPTADPFAGRSSAADSQRVVPLPKVDAGATVRPLSAAVSNDAERSAASQSADSPLRAARLALAVGDIRRAAQFVEQAKSTPVRYQPLDDTPEQVAAAITKYQELSSLDKNTEAYRRATARNLLEQADALLRWGERDEAERLATRAAQLQVVYGPFEQKPQDLLNRIAAVKASGARQNRSPASEPGYANAASASGVGIAARQQAVMLVRQAREAIAAGQFDRAEAIARQAEQLRVPDSTYAPGEDRPGLVLLDLRQLRAQNASGVMPAGGPYQVMQTGANGLPDRTANSAVYNPSNDATRNITASSQQAAGPDLRLAQNTPIPAPPPDPNAGSAAPTSAMALFQQGEAALAAHDTARAYQLFRSAAARMNELDPVTAQRLQDHLQLMSGAAKARGPQPGQPGSMVSEAAARQQALARQVAAELAHKETNARALLTNDPKAALALLQEARKKIETSGLDASTRDQLLRRADRAIAEVNQAITQRAPQIALNEKNARIEQEVERNRRLKVEIGEKLAMKIDEFNRLMDEQRYEEAEVVAKQAAQLDPNNPVVVQVLQQSKLVRNFMAAKSIQEQAEQGFVEAMGEVDRAKIPFAGDKHPMVFPDPKEWNKLTKNRGKLLADQQRQRSERDLEIEKKLRTPVSLQFTNAPLSKVLENLAKLAEVNLHLDPQGLLEEGVTSDTPVTIELRNEIMLKSALHLILEPLHLSYVVKDEVLKITSESMRDGQVYCVTYNVADLVIPIPNFVPTNKMGLEGAYSNAMANVNPWAGTGGFPFGASSQSTPMSVVSREGASGIPGNSTLLAQLTGSGGKESSLHAGRTSGQGPGGLGGGAQPDFDALIDLITTVVKPTSWDAVGGPGSINKHEPNLSLVISQTQEVHEDIADLLTQLRRLQDLQVTIEVRFITLTDNFFERIGVNFDFDISSNVLGKGMSVNSSYANQPINTLATKPNTNRTVTVGLGTPTTYSSDLDIPVTQGGYALAVPQYGGFDATAGASLGFAILSDIEAYFFLNAAQGDKRSNVLQAPKVTLFNGQQAYVSDTSQTPFVISVIPVVGEFAAAQQPVIVVLSEGTFMTVQAVVSNDKRFVRLTVVPYFSNIGEVSTFTFTGSTTTTTDSTREGLNSSATDVSKLWNKTGDTSTSSASGTTVQLPTFSYVTVTTTVSVPDGGTVLLGGIKRLSEGRSEYGVPMLNKIPYLNRLFSNVGIGRESQSLMMMVTPRIIIQEEEEPAP
ncbi:MAG: hypothetical protein LLF97_13205 [Planctomycetaceae bacterium]|nr:hypothetical protein [Planctomycetaceae bacterium]